MADPPPRMFEIGDGVIDTFMKRRGKVVNYGLWEESRVWEYQYLYEWVTEDDIHGEMINWSRIQNPGFALAHEGLLRKVENFQILENVIHPGEKLRGTVQAIGWKEVGQVYVYQCLWKWSTQEFRGPETIWNQSFPTLGWPEEHELRKDFPVHQVPRYT